MVKAVGQNEGEKAKEKGSSHSRDYILVIVIHPLRKIDKVNTFISTSTCQVWYGMVWCSMIPYPLIFITSLQSSY